MSAIPACFESDVEISPQKIPNIKLR